MDPLGPQNRMKVWAGLSTSGGRAPGAPISRSALIAARAATFGTTFDGAANRRFAQGPLFDIRGSVLAVGKRESRSLHRASPRVRPCYLRAALGP
jgi:hypothetical protein